MIPGRPSRQRWASRAAAAALTALVCLLTSGQPAQAAPSAAIVRIDPITPRWLRVFVRSPAMQAVMQVQLLLPRNTADPRPTVYLLDGRTAEGNGNHWTDRGGAVTFFADKPVNVVLTVGGTASYYTDWQRVDPRLGRYRWETFLTKELPPLLDGRFGGDGRNAVAGVSMGAQAALMLAFRNPQRYAAAAGFSGCYGAADDPDEAEMHLVVASSGGNATNMFGETADPDWAAHDVVVHAAALRGKALYLSSGTGLPGPHETVDDPDVGDSIVLGGPIEAVANACTHRLADRLGQLGISAKVNFRPVGTHSWPYWADDLHDAWPTLAAGLGISVPGR
ncbi:esterase family protein [Skermania sp. ID1734]|uniref:alpha/beta hydrolase n=1 Tax=Skermania sp. ID1734 TaxID=2597516 RepID=UPI0011810440|nr:alpha/beta hydrolase family protein [Skermania sp. ID1734]TSE00697.1 esterase family protein [Skermania sp. ID1734]